MKKQKLPPEVLDYFRQHGSEGGKVGGKRALETMTPEERSARAKKASAKAAAVRSKKAAAKRKAAAKNKKDFQPNPPKES